MKILANMAIGGWDVVNRMSFIAIAYFKTYEEAVKFVEERSK